MHARCRFFEKTHALDGAHKFRKLVKSETDEEPCQRYSEKSMRVRSFYFKTDLKKLWSRVTL